MFLWAMIEINRYKFGHGLQLRAHSCSVRLTSATHFQLLRTQGHVFSYSDTPLAISVYQLLSSQYRDILPTE
jgi:hypothetical protein